MEVLLSGKKKSGLAENVKPNPALLIQPKSSYQVEIALGYKDIFKIP